MNEPLNRPIIFVIFGISGDLAHRKLLPALASLHANGHLPEQFQIIGVTRQDNYAIEHLADDVTPFLSETMRNDEHLGTLLEHVTIVANPQSSVDDFRRLRSAIEPIVAAFGSDTLRLYYLSIPAQAFVRTVQLLGESGHNQRFGDERELPRILVEKPFGYDSTSAQELIDGTAQVFRDSEVYRIDHYLAKETAQNILTFRFDNSLFDNSWNTEQISRIKIVAHETIDIEGRAHFYEQTGALRDIIQSHLLQLLALVMMEQPASLDSAAIHEQKLAFLRQVRSANPDQAIRGQYSSYRESTENPTSLTETFARLTLSVDSDLWRDTEIVLQTGKGLHEKTTHVEIEFRPADDTQTPNILYFRLAPREGVTIGLRAKRPGLTHATEPVAMSFYYDTSFEANVSEAYERVIVDAMRGDQSLFASSQEVMESWRIIQPALDRWSTDGTDLIPYELGTDPTTFLT